MNSGVVGGTACYEDTTASSHMVDAQSRMYKNVVNQEDCAVRIIGLCGTSSCTKKSNLKFGIPNTQDVVVSMTLEVLLV